MRTPGFSDFSRKICMTFRAAAREDDGMVAVLFGLTLLPIMLFVGAGIDFMRVGRARSELQQALDAATLAATTNVANAPTILSTNQPDASLLKSATVSWTKNVDGSITGAANAKVPTTFLQLAHLDSISISASSTATNQTARTASDVNFTLTGAYGWYWKEIDLYVHTAGASKDTIVASYFYQPVDLSAQGGRGTGTTTAQFLSGGAMVAGPVNTSISLGSNYDNAYLTMTVYSDGCGPGMAPTTSQSGSTTNYKCVASGTKISRTTYTKTAAPVIYSTSNANQSRNLFVNGVNMYSTTTAPSIVQLLPCAKGATTATNTHAWEDTPYNGSLTGGSWSNQDIFFSIQTTCAANAYYDGVPKLTK
ncbi:hypothetical protein MJC1_02012 [Methylocystis sp. MJC1]|nr:hypothetical protein MJC1_02012 [Methylocystis sp. MJC1]